MARAPVPAAPCPRERRPAVLVATILGSSMAFIDGTIVNLALPALQEELGATVDRVQWVVEAYALMLAALLLLGGALGDRFGRRRIFGIGVVAFGASSVLCGLAPNITALIAARALQGVAGALLVPGSLAILSATFPADERGGAIGAWSGFSSVSAGLGLVLGGAIVEQLGWRAAFFLNVPIAAVTLALVAWRVPESRGDTTRAPLDVAGGALATVGLGGVTFGLIEASERGVGSPAVLVAVLGGLAGIAAFVLREARASEPMMPMSLFRIRPFAGANLVTLLVYAALGGVMFFVPLNLIQVQGYTATEAGAANLPFVVVLGVLSHQSGKLADKHGARGPMAFGIVLASIGIALFAFAGGHRSYWVSFFPAIVVMGLGMACVVAPLTTVVMSSVGASRAGVASGVNNAISRVGGLLAVALLGPVVVAIFERSLRPRLGAVSPALADAVVSRAGELGALTAPAGTPATLAAHVDRAVDGAFIDAFSIASLATAAVALVGGLAGVLWMGPDPRRSDGAVSRRDVAK